MAEGKDGWAGTIKGRPEQGASAERSRTTKLDDIHAFTAMTGDRNPVTIKQNSNGLHFR